MLMASRQAAVGDDRLPEDQTSRVSSSNSLNANPGTDAKSA